MKALFIGGTGTISSAITKQLLESGCELYLLNRGTRNESLPAGPNCSLLTFGMKSTSLV